MRIGDIVDEACLQEFLNSFTESSFVQASSTRSPPKGWRPQPRLSKSRYIAGLQCPRRLWLGWHDPEPRPEPQPGSALAVGIDVGVAARQIIPGGVLVEAGPEQHAEAVERTRELVADPTVPAIFEAAFTFNNIVIRADILERLLGGVWRLAEVKSTKRVKPEHLHDLAIQTYVIENSGIPLREAHLVHVNSSYVRGETGIDWHAYFRWQDVTTQVRDLLPSVPERVTEMHATLALTQPPEIRPSRHCFSPYECEFWSRCTANKPPDWIFHLPRLRQTAFAKLEAAGVESMRDIPADFPLSSAQRRVIDAVVAGRELIADGLRDALTDLGPPSFYLDFETFSPALPIYAGTGPFQRIPFQFSLHYDDADGTIKHSEYLAAGDVEPRREFAETLLRALECTAWPIIVYSSFESKVLCDLVALLPDLSARLLVVIDRLADLLPIIRKHISHPEFLGSYSIKDVAPVLVPGFGYSDLIDVMNGDAASIMFYRLATDRSLRLPTRLRFRRALLRYCQRDTLAMMQVHRRLLNYNSVNTLG